MSITITLQAGSSSICRPCVKNIAVHTAIEGSESKWHGATQGTDNVGLCLAPSGYACAFYFEEFTAFFFVCLAVVEVFFFNGEAIAFERLADAVL